MASNFISDQSNEDPKKKTRKFDHGVRSCPKKSRKFQSLHVCNVCQKEFQSPKSLFGHMRVHSGKAKKWIPCKMCGDEFLSMKSLINHMGLHLDRVPDVPRVCSISTFAEKSFNETNAQNLAMEDGSHMNKFKASSSSFSLSSFNKSSSVTDEIEQEEIEEVAMTLVMLSEDIYAFGNVPRDDSITLEIISSNHNSQRVKIKPVMDDPLMDSAELKPKSNGLQTHSGLVKSSAYRNFRFDDACRGELLAMPCLINESHESCQNNSGYRCKTCHKVFSCFQGLGGHRSRGCHFGFAESNSLHDPTVSETNKGDVAESKRTCRSSKSCGKVLSCFQSLGGHHQARHRSDKRCFVSKNNNFGGYSLSSSSDCEVHKNGSKNKHHEVAENVTEVRKVDLDEHKCLISLKLGVHTMNHLAKGFEITAERGEIRDLIDSPMDEESSDKWIKMRKE